MKIYTCSFCNGTDTVCAEDGQKYCSSHYPKVNYCFTCEELSSPDFLTARCLCDDKDNPNKVYCEYCKVFRATGHSAWEWMNKAIPKCDCEDVNSNKCFTCGVERENEQSAWKFSNRKYRYTYSCQHYNNELILPNDTAVYASSCHMRDLKKDTPPDFGLYLDGLWKPMGPAYLLGWQDYGLPYNWTLAAQMIYEVYYKAVTGKWIEVGCIAGHGRTGTVLACMAVLAGLSAPDAVNYVRNKYCNNAMETIDQEWWVSWFEAYMLGGSTPGKPAPYNYSKKQISKYEPKVFSYDYGWLENMEGFFLNSETEFNESSTTWATKNVRIKK